MRVLTAEESRALDAAAISGGVPGLGLMERASAAVVREIARAASARPERLARIVVVAGLGNNGGDGFVVARLLSARHDVETLVFGDPARLSGDAATAHDRLTAAGGRIRVVRIDADLEPLRSATLVVDALQGTGLARPLSGLAASYVDLLSTVSAFIVAVDIPSGLFASQGDVPGPHVRAHLTVTFGTPKIAHLLLPAAGACGRVVVADIGLGTPPPNGSLLAVTAADVAPLFPWREAASHKGTYGRLLVVGGSDGMAGAPALAACAAHRVGVGLVTVAAPEGARPTIHVLSPESMTTSLSALLTTLPPADALAVGPGLGQGSDSEALVGRLAASARPAVFDADALNLAAKRPELLAGRSGGTTVLTPHPGEAGRLLGRAIAAGEDARQEAARELAARYGSVVVLKGFRSVVADPTGRCELVLSGNPGMASGGMGDVLTGIVGAFLARRLTPWDAARAAAFLHGLAGDLAAERLSQESLTATDVLSSLGDAFQAVVAR